MSELPDDDYLWNTKAAPDPDIVRLETLLAPVRMKDAHAIPRDLPSIRRVPSNRTLTMLAALAASIVLAVVGYELTHENEDGVPWSVTASTGSPLVRSHEGAATNLLANGGTIETDARSTARLMIGEIGRAELGRDSRLRLVDAGSGVNRLALERGTMHATVDAPPRFFLVETPSSLVTDLGCDYTITTDSIGNGTLEVGMGEVELESGARHVSVLAGNAVAMLAGRGAGLPYPRTSTRALRAAVAAFDHAPSAQAVAAVISASDRGSTITLWHLLQAAPESSRGAVFDRLAALSAPPSSVTRERVIRGESYALQRWRTELEKTWARPSLWAKLLSELQPDGGQ